MTLDTLRDWFRPRTRVLAADEAYEMWADTYPPYPHNPVMEIEEAIVAPLIVACAPRRALDAGTGTGRNLRLLEAAGAGVIVGVDLSQAMLRRHVRPRGRVRANACALPFANAQFDFVCSSLMAGDLADLAGWIREAARVLTPGGHLVYSDFHPDWAVRGWLRTFTGSDGCRRQVSYVPHAVEEHLAHCANAPLQVRAIREPRLSGQSSPIVVVFHLQKTR